MEDAFFVVAIIYMIFMMLVTIGVVIALAVIGSKISRAKRRLNRKVHALRGMADSLGGFMYALRYIVRGRRY